jgi:hypothetical protein
MTEWMTLPEIENRIKELYVFFSVTAPGVWPRETGELGALWALADAEYAKEAA